MSLEEKITMYVEGQAIPDPTECFAVPGENHIIDVINPLTDKTAIYGRTLDEVRKQPGNEKAERMSIDQFCKDKAARQNTPIGWREITEEKYHEMLEVLPPIEWTTRGFMVSEPCDHHALTGKPRYGAYVTIGHRFFTASRPLTREEFRKAKDAL